ncbi:sulfatase [Marinifilum sp.]|uniref:sulfatase n=1 Tax=Marinifilum sp. TaxID=2033137 RepID=UPI003BA9D49E
MIIKIKFLLLLTCIVYSACAKKNNEEVKPNILLINIDDLGWKDVGFMGSEYYNTPNLDNLSTKGIVFTNAYAAASNCAPSRACLMSGEWPQRHGIFTVDNSERGKSKDRKIIPVKNTTDLGKDFVTIAETLKSNGYATCHAGKWHLSNDPKDHGFDINIAGTHAGNPGKYYSPYPRKLKYKSDTDEYLTDAIMNDVLSFIDGVDDEPFFLYYSPYAVHTPINPIDSLMPRYENKPGWRGQDNPGYATMIDNLDRNIGNLIALLKRKDLYANTLIIFTSDNGGTCKVTEQRPLRAGKGSYYEGGIREPFFVVWPGRISPGLISNVPISNLDIYPTLLEVSQSKVCSNYLLDGQSITELFDGSEPASWMNRELYWHYPIYLQANSRKGQFRDDKFRTRPGSAMRKGNWKLHQYFEDGSFELFNLKEDIGEQNDLSKSNPKKLKELRELLTKWQRETNAPIPTKANPNYISE